MWYAFSCSENAVVQFSAVDRGVTVDRGDLERMDNVYHTIFLRDTRSFIDSQIPHGYLRCTCGV